MLDKIHTTKDGEHIHIVSMDDDHLVNTIRMFLLKLPYEYEQSLREKYISEYADDKLPSNLNALLGKKRLSKQSKELVEDGIREKVDSFLREVLEKAMPYIIIGISRTSTYEKVHKIIQTFTGIESKIEMKVSRMLMEPDDDDYELDFYEEEDDF